MFFSLRRSPFTRVRATIHVQYLTRGERRIRQEQNCIDDFLDFTDPANRVQPFQKIVGLRLCIGV